MFYKNKIKRLKLIDELLLLTKGKCLLSFEEAKDDDKMTYHHLHKRKKGGKKTFENGVPLLQSNHDFLNIIERDNNELYCDINCALDSIKEALEMNYILRSIYYEDDRLNKADASIEEDFNYLEYVDIDDVDEEMEVDYFSINQLIEIRKAITLYKKEFVPAFMEAKQQYIKGEIYQYNINGYITLKKEKKIIIA